MLLFSLSIGVVLVLLASDDDDFGSIKFSSRVLFIKGRNDLFLRFWFVNERDIWEKDVSQC